MAKHIPKPFIQDLLTRVDIVSLIEGRVPLKKAGANYQARCPFHQEKTPSFSVSPTKQFYHCFGCGANGNAIGFLMAFDRLTFVEAVEVLARFAGLEIPYENVGGDESKSEGSNLEPLYSLMAEAANYYFKELLRSQPAIDYLKNRGLTKTVVKKFLIGYAPNAWDSILSRFGNSPEQVKLLLAAGMVIQGDRQKCYDRFRDRIMFPIRDRRGRFIGFGGRIINPKDTPKYLNSPETSIFHKGHELYGWHEVTQQHRHLKRVLIVEGYMDVAGLAESGIDYAMATLGTATSAEHIQRLFRLTREVVFCFDGDQAGVTAAWRALEVLLPLLQDEWQPRFIFLPQGEDPDTFVQKIGKEKFEEYIEKATTLSEFFFSHLTAEVDPQKMDHRAVLANKALQYLRKIPANLTREMLMQKLARMVHLPVEKLDQYLEEGPQSPEPVLEVSFASITKKSPVRTAVTLLLQCPELVDRIQDESLAMLDIQGIDLFKELIESIRKMKKTNEAARVTTAMVLEYWRDREEIKHLSRLAMIEVMLPEHAIEEELKGALKKLEQQSVQLRIERLMAKAGLNALSEEDKIDLKKLLLLKRNF